MIHKFVQKCRFKGRWDTIGKHVKYAILKNGIKFDHCNDAKACYYKIKRNMKNMEVKKRKENGVSGNRQKIKLLFKILIKKQL